MLGDGMKLDIRNDRLGKVDGVGTGGKNGVRMAYGAGSSDSGF